MSNTDNDPALLDFSLSNHPVFVQLFVNRSFCKKKTRNTSSSFRFGGATQIRTGGKGFAVLCLTTWPWRLIWSERRDSNSRPSPWQGEALPLSYFRKYWCPEAESNHRHGDFQSPALPTELSGLTATSIYYNITR